VFYIISLTLHFSTVCDTRTCVHFKKGCPDFSGLFYTFDFEKYHYLYELEIVLHEHVWIKILCMFVYLLLFC